jgi:hypothetical protein
MVNTSPGLTAFDPIAHQGDTAPAATPLGVNCWCLQDDETWLLLTTLRHPEQATHALLRELGGAKDPASQSFLTGQPTRFLRQHSGGQVVGGQIDQSSGQQTSFAVGGALADAVAHPL